MRCSDCGQPRGSRACHIARSLLEEADIVTAETQARGLDAWTPREAAPFFGTDRVGYSARLDAFRRTAWWQRALWRLGNRLEALGLRLQAWSAP